MKYILMSLLTLTLISCGMTEHVSDDITNDSPEETTPTPEVEIEDEEVVEAINQYFYNDFSESNFDVGVYEDWYDENGDRVDYQDHDFYNTTDNRLELNYTDALGVSVYQFLFHATDGLTNDLARTAISGYQTLSDAEALASGDLVTLKIYYTIPDDSSIDGVYASLYWMDENNVQGSDEILLSVEDRFRYGDNYIPVSAGETNVLSVTFTLDEDDPSFDYDSIYFDLILEAEYSDETSAKLYITSIEILRE